MQETELTLNNRDYFYDGIEDRNICAYDLCGCVEFKSTERQVRIRIAINFNSGKYSEICICNFCFSFNMA